MIADLVHDVMAMTTPLDDPVEPVASTGSGPTAARLLDVLQTHECSQNDLRRELQALVDANPDEAWELLSLIDQHYRLGRIRADNYQAANSCLTTLLLGPTQSAESRGRLHPVDHVEPTAAAPEPAAPFEAHAQQPDDAAFVGRTLRDRYQVLRVVGHGGLGTVYEAVDLYRIGPPDERRVALKVLHASVNRRPGMLSALLREFQHVQLMSHPNIVRVHDFDRDGATTFFTMELLGGLTLEALLNARGHKAFELRHALAIMRDLGAALAHAHARGIVHGDVNPHNIFVTDAGAVRVLDFGSSAKARTEPWICDADSPEPARFATRRYASCELLEGRVAEVRDDLFACACVAYELLTGEHPFAGRTALEARTARIVPRRPAGLARGRWRALRAGLSLQRDRRPTDVGQWTGRLIADSPIQPLPNLAALTRSRPLKRARGLRVGAEIAVLLILTGTWFATTVHDPQFITVATNLRVSALRVAAAAGDFLAGVAQSASRGILRFDRNRVAAEPRSAPIAKPAHRDRAVTATPPIDATAAHAAAPVRRATPPMRRVAPGVVQPARIELAVINVSVPPRTPFARVVVRRRGNLRATVSFRWGTVSGTARRDKDFVVVGPRIAYIPGGRLSTDLLIPIVSDPTRTQPVTFYVIIKDAGPGAEIGPRTIAMVTIPASN